jgi:CDP-diacylglycerol--serine O-phosphatidyltransferase
MFIVKINKSVILTYLGVVFAVISMYFSFTKIAFAEINYVRYSFIFLILAGLCDMFDGKVARMCKRTEKEKQFGIQIDSLADTVNFLCLPVIIMLSLGMSSIIDVVVYSFFILCGLSRLGYFNVNAKLDSPVKFYNGLPVTSTSIIYPVIGLLHGQVPDNIFQIILIVATLITSILFIFRITIPKFKGAAYIVIPILAVLLSILLLVIR